MADLKMKDEENTCSYQWYTANSTSAHKMAQKYALNAKADTVLSLTAKCLLLRCRK